MSTDPRAMLRQATAMELPVEVCLDGKLVAEHHELRRAFERADEEPRERITSGGEARRLGDELRALEERIRAATVNVRLRSLGKDGWNDLVDKHPARPGEETDEKLGYNADTFFDELVSLSMVAMAPLNNPDSAVDLTDEDRVMLLGVVTRDKFDELTRTALSLNIRRVDIPFSSAASKRTTPSDSE